MLTLPGYSETQGEQERGFHLFHASLVQGGDE